MIATLWCHRCIFLHKILWMASFRDMQDVTKFWEQCQCLRVHWCLLRTEIFSRAYNPPLACWRLFLFTVRVGKCNLKYYCSWHCCCCGHTVQYMGVALALSEICLPSLIEDPFFQVASVFKFFFFIFRGVFRSTSKSRPNNNIRGEKCPSVRTSVRPQKVSSIWMKFGM